MKVRRKTGGLPQIDFDYKESSCYLKGSYPLLWYRGTWSTDLRRLPPPRLSTCLSRWAPPRLSRPLSKLAPPRESRDLKRWPPPMESRDRPAIPKNCVFFAWKVQILREEKTYHSVSANEENSLLLKMHLIFFMHWRVESFVSFATATFFFQNSKSNWQRISFWSFAVFEYQF